MLTNNYNLPPVIQAAIERDSAVEHAGLLSASAFSKPTRAIILTKRYGDKIEKDVSESLWALFGTGVHKALEGVSGMVEELSLSAEICGEKISGRLDGYDQVSGDIWDYKVTSAWTIVFGSRAQDWKTQMSVYRYLLDVNGYKTSGMAHILAILRDHDKKKAGEKYPALPVHVTDIELKPVEEIKKAIESKIKAVKKAMLLPDEELPECTPEERWEGYDKTKKCLVSRRCSYCVGTAYCSQAKALNAITENKVID
jgi:hypothetical protein